MIVGILLLVVAIINIMEAFRKQKIKLIFRTCNYLVFPVVYLICCLFNIFGDYYKKIKYCIENVIIKNNSSLI